MTNPPIGGVSGVSGMLGKLLGGKGSHGSGHGGHSSHGGYGGGYGGGYHPKPNLAHLQGKRKGHGMGAGGLALGAGAGILGGVLLADAIDDFGDASYDNGTWRLLYCLCIFDDGG